MKGYLCPVCNFKSLYISLYNKNCQMCRAKTDRSICLNCSLTNKRCIQCTLLIAAGKCYNQALEMEMINLAEKFDNKILNTLINNIKVWQKIITNLDQQQMLLLCKID